MARTESLSMEDGIGGETASEAMPQEAAADSPPLSVVPEAAAEAAETTTGEESDASGARETRGALEALPVRIDFHAGQVTLPLGSLGNLAPGYTIGALDEGGFPLVRAVSAGRTFAEGELVDIDGVIGFRILRLVE